MIRKVDVAILGAGTAGLSALAQVRRGTDSFVLIDGGELGTTCARVGCMPSKVLVQIAEDFHRRGIFKRHGITGAGSLELNIPDALEHVRDLRDIFVDRVLAGTTDQLGDRFIDADASFEAPDRLILTNGDRIQAGAVIIATGSRPIVPAAWQAFADRVLTTDDLFEQEDLPGSIAVVGLGAVGLEIGQSLTRAGISTTGLDQLERIGGLYDPVVAQTASEIFGKEFPLWLGHAAQIEPDGERLRVHSGDRATTVDKVFAALGRRPNLDRLGLEHIGVALNERGVPRYDPGTMQVGSLRIYIAGDVDGDRPVLHEASHEGRVAGLNALGDKPVAYRRRVPLAITFCEPQIAMVGAPFNEGDHVAGTIRVGPVGRALIMGRNKGAVRVYAMRDTGHIAGAEMVCPGAEHLAHLLALAVQQNMTVRDMLQLPFYHPTLEEILQAALRDLGQQIGQRGPELIPE